MKRGLYPYQKIGADFLASRRRAALYDEMGLGKTIQAIAACYILKLTKVLVICPASLKANWENEFAKWYPLTTGKTIVSFNFIQKEKQAKWLGNDTGKSTKLWDAVIVDESDRLGNWKSSQTQNFIKFVAPKCKRIWLLSGTPAVKSAANFFPQLSALLPGEIGKYSDFLNHHCYRREVGYGKWRRVQYEGFRNTAELRKLVRSVSIRRTVDQVLKDLPPVRFSELLLDVDVEEPPEVEEDEIDEDIPPEPIVPYIRELGLEKAKQAIEYIKSFNGEEPVVLFCWFKDCKKYLVENLTKAGYRVGVISGSESPKKKTHYIKLLQEGRLDYLVCNIMAGGIGHTFTRARTCIFVELPWSAAAYVQAWKRLHRLTQTRRVNVINCVGKDSLDYRILAKIRSKSQGMEKCLA